MFSAWCLEVLLSEAYTYHKLMVLIYIQCNGHCAIVNECFAVNDSKCGLCKQESGNTWSEVIRHMQL